MLEYIPITIATGVAFRKYFVNKLVRERKNQPILLAATIGLSAITSKYAGMPVEDIFDTTFIPLQVSLFYPEIKDGLIKSGNKAYEIISEPTKVKDYFSRLMNKIQNSKPRTLEVIANI